MRIFIALLTMVLFTTGGLCATTENRGEPDILSVHCDGNLLTVQASRVPFSDILEEISAQCGISFAGVSTGANSVRIDFEDSGAAETVIRHLLRKARESNFAFEFEDTGLFKVTIFPSSSAPARTLAAESPEAAAPPPPESPGENSLPIVRVTEVVEDTQALELGLETGDVVFEYAGQRITAPGQLVALVKEHETDREKIEIKVLRGDNMLRFFMEPGLVGVRIVSDRVLKEYLDKFTQ